MSHMFLSIMAEARALVAKLQQLVATEVSAQSPWRESTFTLCSALPALSLPVCE